MRKNVRFLLLFIVLIAGGVLYWYYFAPLTAFPDKEEIRYTLGNSNNGIHAAEIQDTIFLDDKHVFIPFITETESHGISFWEWRNHEWQLTSFSVGSMPQIWKIDSEDPETYYVIWNFHPENDLDYLTFYLMKDLGYSITEGKHQYSPGVQMDFRSEVGEQSYGYSQIPPEWQEYIEAEIKLMEAMKPDFLFADFYPPAQYYFGWQSTLTDGTIEYPSYPDNNGFGSGSQSTETLRFLNENEIYLKETGSSE
ncbi:hypothetical protein J7I80_03610 [Bacillus sp. ISL-41]|uniref:hypothetical protein n=1 Tax=Bacillus sp. ISL-41 TaxID=2819127 RepID=UPI001BE922DD|nr:hypothetical protein [Bacillus sp. ISL-41]MBT2641315.1 hypothetical protein [Bacillus sp. ISL-41]